MLSAYAVAAAFTTYFSMYAFRKPFAAATYESTGVHLFGSEISQKTLYVIAQIIGYAMSKYIGVKVCSEVGRTKRFAMLASLILCAELALVAFALLPTGAPLLKAVVLLANGLPLGMVWGLVVLYLEGRRMSEVLLTGLSCSYIVASGIVKDVGRAILAGTDFALPTPASWGWSLPNPFPALPEFWMPAATGALFLPVFFLSAWLLEQVPDPSNEDKDNRAERFPMRKSERREFFLTYKVAIIAALTAFFLLTAFRDYRDNYVVEVFTQLGYEFESHRTIVSRAELVVALGVMAILSQLYRFHDNRRGLIATHTVMIAGLTLMGVSTLLLDAGQISGFWWVTLIGFGAYLAYVPFGAVLFDRAIACTRFTGTAVFGIYLADAIGYTGSVALQLSKDFLLGSGSHLFFLRMLAYLVAIVGVAGLTTSCFYFTRQPQPIPDPVAAELRAAV